MNRADLLTRLGGIEYFDNSRLVKTRGCIRRAFYEQIGPAGTPLASGTGDGAAFGSVFHEGLAEFYRNHTTMDLRTRRLHALNFTKSFYHTKFDKARLDVDRKHTLHNALVVLDAYFEQFKGEDEHYDVLAAELGLAVLIKPEPGDPSDFHDPFWFLGRMDGLYAYKSGERLVKETKSMGSGDPAKRLELLRFNRQPVGYVYLTNGYLRTLGDDRLCWSFLGDVALVSATQLEFARDTFAVSETRLASWRFQTILMVEEWRRFRRTMGEHYNDPAYFDYAIQDTEECNKYNTRCTFYKLCEFGPMSPDLQDYKPELWTPFEDLAENDTKFIE